MSARRLLDVPAAAEYLGTTPDALRKLVQRRQIPFMRQGKRTLRFDIRQLDAWIADRTTQAAS